MQTRVTLQHICKVGDVRVQNVRLREINGHDERRLVEMGSAIPTFLQSAELLGRVAKFEGLPEESRHDALQYLSIGDRVLLMLYLRKEVLGDSMHCTLDCPKCSEKMSLDLSVNALAESGRLARDNGSVTVGDISMVVRPPTHMDQQILLSNDTEGMQTFARSCIVSCNSPITSGVLDDTLFVAIDDKLRQLDPLADIALELKCPACGHDFEAPFDPEMLFLDEMAMRNRQLDWEVHWLAFHYHWSENSILSLAASRRRRYIELINESLSREAT